MHWRIFGEVEVPVARSHFLVWTVRACGRARSNLLRHLRVQHRASVPRWPAGRLPRFGHCRFGLWLLVAFGGHCGLDELFIIGRLGVGHLLPGQLFLRNFGARLPRTLGQLGAGHCGHNLLPRFGHLGDFGRRLWFVLIGICGLDRPTRLGCDYCLDPFLLGGLQFDVGAHLGVEAPLQRR